MTEVERVEIVRKYLKISKKEFSELIGYAYPQNYTKLLNGQSKLSIKILEGLSRYDSNINTHWILTGLGAMFFDGELKKIINGNNNITQVGGDNNASYTNEVQGIDNFKKIELELNSLRLENASLHKLLKKNEELLKSKDVIISLLNQKK